MFYYTSANHVPMDTEAAFERIKNDIKDEKYDMVLPQVKEIVGQCNGDISILFKCASLLKVVEEEDYCQEILDGVVKNLPAEEEQRMEVAIALRGIGRFKDSYDIMTSFKTYVPDAYELALSTYYVEKYEEALSILDKADRDDQKSMILMTDIHCALGDYDKAMEIADKTIYYYGSGYDTLVNKCNVMFKSGKTKDAIKFAKSYVKESKSNNDASRVLKDDHTHIGALETMAMCLIEKKSFINAKLLAGAINDADPGNPAAVRILDACRLLSS